MLGEGAPGGAPSLDVADLDRVQGARVMARIWFPAPTGGSTESVLIYKGRLQSGDLQHGGAA